MAEPRDDQIQEGLDFDGRREWLSKPEVRRLLLSLAYRRLGLIGEAAKELVQDFYTLKLDPVARAYDPTRLDPALVITAFIRFGYSKLGRNPGPPLLSINDPAHELTIHKALQAPAETREIPQRDHRDPELLNQALARLPDSARSLINAFYLEDLSQSEIAEREGKTVAAIKIALHRARHLLRQSYIEEVVALTVSDISSFPTFIKKIASQSSMPHTPVGSIFSLLPSAVQTSSYVRRRTMLVPRSTTSHSCVR